MVQDAANFLRIVSFLVFTLSLITFFRQGRQVRRAIPLGFGVNFGLFWLLIRPGARSRQAASGRAQIISCLTALWGLLPALRFGLLAVVALLGFIVSGKKRLYIVFYAAAGVFWVLHMANCFRIGYQSMVQDAA